MAYRACARCNDAGRLARIRSQRGMAGWPEKRILSRAGKRMGKGQTRASRVNRDRASPVASGKGRPFCARGVQCNGHTPTGGKSDEAETRIRDAARCGIVRLGGSAEPGMAMVCPPRARYLAPNCANVGLISSAGADDVCLVRIRCTQQPP